jgi:hypothetical protein
MFPGGPGLVQGQDRMVTFHMGAAGAMPRGCSVVAPPDGIPAGNTTSSTAKANLGVRLDGIAADISWIMLTVPTN